PVVPSLMSTPPPALPRAAAPLLERPIVLPTTFVPVAVSRSTPAPVLPEMTLPSPLVVPPITSPLEPPTTTPVPLPTALVPAAFVPIRLAFRKLFVAGGSGPAIRTPASPLPETRLPLTVPEDSSKKTPLPWFPTGAVPAAFVPIVFPLTTLSCESKPNE